MQNCFKDWSQSTEEPDDCEYFYKKKMSDGYFCINGRTCTCCNDFNLGVNLYMYFEDQKYLQKSKKTFRSTGVTLKRSRLKFNQWLGRYYAEMADLYSLYRIVILEIRSRSPKSNQLFPYLCKLVKIHPMVQKIRHVNPISAGVTLKIRLRSPKSNPLFSPSQ